MTFFDAKFCRYLLQDFNLLHRRSWLLLKRYLQSSKFCNRMGVTTGQYQFGISDPAVLWQWLAIRHVVLTLFRAGIGYRLWAESWYSWYCVARAARCRDEGGWYATWFRRKPYISNVYATHCPSVTFTLQHWLCRFKWVRYTKFVHDYVLQTFVDEMKGAWNTEKQP